MFDYTGLIGLGMAQEAEDKLQTMKTGIQKVVTDLERDSRIVSDPTIKRYLLDTANELRRLL